MSQAFQDWGADASLKEVRSRLWSWMQKGHDDGFLDHALALFRWQAVHNAPYRAFVEAMNVQPEAISALEDIPFLPVEVFKSHEVKSGAWESKYVFRSSGTTQTTSRAQHWMDDNGLSWYAQVSRLAWQVQWNGPVADWAWLGLLPGYIGREDASLLTMVADFMAQTGSADEGMLMHDHGALNARVKRHFAEHASRQLMLFGVTWAILDWLDALEDDQGWLDSIPWRHVTLIETGGMKGRGTEPIREQVHARIQAVLPDIRVASEYGMTEMMSQGYAKDGSHHAFPCWVKPLVREPQDPRSPALQNRVGRLDIVDLANVHSCAFLATGDAANLTPNGLILLGRQDHSEVRGCSLLATP